MIQMELSVEQEEITMEIQEVFENKGGETDYERLNNLPRLNGEVIKGDMKETDPTVPSWAKQKTKPAYTAEEVGALSADAEVSYEEIDKWFE